MAVANIILTMGGIKIATDISVQSGLLFCGALALLCFFSILIYLKSRKRIYLYYFLFLLFSLIEAAIYMRHTELIGLLVQTTQDQASITLELVTLLAFSSYCLFTIRLLNIRFQNKKLFYWILMMAILGAAYGVAYYFIRPSSSDVQLYAFIFSRIVILFMSIVAILWIVIKKIKSEVIGYFLAGSAFYFIGAFVAVLRGTITGLPISWLYQYPSETYFQWGIFFEIICFTIAIAIQIYHTYEDRQEEQIKRSTLAIYEKELAQAETLALRIQINPHFLFNYLNVLKYYIQIEENKKAVQYLVKFSQFLRKIIDSNQQKTISLEQELDIIDHYLSLEEIRFNRECSYELRTDANIDISQIQIPPLLLQPYMEDSLWSGIDQDEVFPRQIIIAIHQTDHLITIIIEEDNAAPETIKNTEDKKFHKAFNRDINADRIALFNKNFDKTIQIETANQEELQRKNKLSQTIIKINFP